MDLEQELQKLKERNKRVEADKAWETSLFRKVAILVTTYLVASLAMFVIGVQNFFMNAIIPTLGFFLSTLTFPFFKKWWIAHYFAQ